MFSLILHKTAWVAIWGGGYRSGNITSTVRLNRDLILAEVYLFL